jgi:hypothetical protein
MSSTPSVSALRARIETTARALLSGYEEGSSQQDASIINRDVASDCRRFLLPASVPATFGLPADFYFDTVKYQETFANDIKRLAFKSNVMSNLVIDTETRRAAFTSVADVETRAGEKYQAEMAWTLYFNKDGSKVEKVVEFCDKDVVLRMANTGE